MSTHTDAPYRIAPTSQAWGIRRISALAGASGPALFAAILVLTDVLQYRFLVRNGFDPLVAAPVSDNEWGPYAFLQFANFAQIGILTLVFAIGFDRNVSATRWRWLGLLPILTLGMAFIAATSRCDCGSFHNTSPVPGTIHSIGFFTTAATGTLGPWLVWLRLRTDLRWRSAARWTFWQAVFMPALVIVLQLMPSTFSWFYIWLTALLIWMGMLGVQLWRLWGADQ